MLMNSKAEYNKQNYVIKACKLKRPNWIQETNIFFQMSYKTKLMDHWVYILKCNNNKISFSAFIFLCKERERESFWNKLWSCNISKKYHPTYIHRMRRRLYNNLASNAPFRSLELSTFDSRTLSFVSSLVLYQSSFIGWWMFIWSMLIIFYKTFSAPSPESKKEQLKVRLSEFL